LSIAEEKFGGATAGESTEPITPEVVSIRAAEETSAKAEASGGLKKVFSRFWSKKNK
jgi:hypothetical protein